MENLGVVPRPSSTRLEEQYDKLFRHITQTKSSDNSFAYCFRLFKKAATAQLGFPSITHLRKYYGKVIGSLYIFKLQYPYGDGYNYALHIKINGYVSRKLLDGFVNEAISVFTEGTAVVMAANPRLKKAVSMYDFIQSLYVYPENLLVNLSQKSDIIAEDADTKLDYDHVHRLKVRITYLTQQIFDNMLTMPTRYPTCHITSLLKMSRRDFKNYMRTTDLTALTKRACQDAFNIAIYDYQFKPQDVQELLEPLTRTSLIQRSIRYENTKSIYMLFQERFGHAFIHPHPLSSVCKKELHHYRPLDGLIFDVKFLLPLLMTARWLVKATIRDQESMTNDCAHLLLYGGSGTGKSLLVSAIAKCINTYKYLAASRFYNPDLLESSFFQLEEFETVHLASNQYKQLLDIKAPVKIDFKNLHPENVSDGVSCMITTNDEVLSLLRSYKRYNQYSVDAALRRLYIIPLKMGKFNSLHGPLPLDTVHYDALKYNGKYQSEPDKLERIFNLMFAFGIHYRDIDHVAIEPELAGYIDKVAKDFRKTVFGTFYLQEYDKVDKLIEEVERLMMTRDINDTEYLMYMGVAAGQLQYQVTEFFIDVLGNQAVPAVVDAVKDPAVPQPVKFYYVRDQPQFIAELMWREPLGVLNSSVAAFLKNPETAPFESEESQPIMSSSSGTVPVEKYLDPLDPMFMSPVPTARILSPVDVLIGYKRSFSRVFENAPSPRSLINDFNRSDDGIL